ncbi:hypothetical protein S40288_04867 [Stachybotrys chartarum IBT 40288]|nr:hypothetical protein S40288_04867 [Stachybotrys chartarum IBT 40288]
MAMDPAGCVSVVGLLLAVSLAAGLARAVPELQCPDYVTTYAPLVWLHSDDPYMPSDILTHVQHTKPQLDGKPIPDVPALDLDNLDVLNDFGDQVALTSIHDPTTFPAWIFGKTPDEAGQVHNATPAVVVLVEKNELDLDAFYFYFYSYNEGPNITQVLEPLNRIVDGPEAQTGMHFGDHVGDWEHNMIRFQNGTPQGIYYSQHRDGKGYSWSDPAVSKKDERPYVYSGRGSHANYPEPGAQIHDQALIDWCDQGQIWDPVASAYFYRFNATTSELTHIAGPGESSPPSANLTSFLYFNGRWGDREYPVSDPRQKIIPRFGLRRFETGPSGPLTKHLLRKGLEPDEKRILTWVEWSAGVLMWWYPCCIRGWRKWVFLTLFIVLLTGIVLGVVHLVMRLRNRRRRAKQGVSIGLDDLNFEEEGLLESSDDEREERDLSDGEVGYI